MSPRIYVVYHVVVISLLKSHCSRKDPYPLKEGCFGLAFKFDFPLGILNYFPWGCVEYYVKQYSL